MKAAALTLVAMMMAPPALAYQVEEVCAVYLGTGKAYRVEAQIMDGSELNDRAGGYRFSSIKTYVLIWWAEEEVSIIELDYSFGPTISGTEGEDQNGYRWDVSTSSYCSDQ